MKKKKKSLSEPEHTRFVPAPVLSVGQLRRSLSAEMNVPPAGRRIWLGINVHLCCSMVHGRLRSAAQQQDLCLILSSHIFPHLGGFPAALPELFIPTVRSSPGNSCDPVSCGPAPSPPSSPQPQSLLICK